MAFPFLELFYYILFWRATIKRVVFSLLFIVNRNPLSVPLSCKEKQKKMDRIGVVLSATTLKKDVFYLTINFSIHSGVTLNQLAYSASFSSFFLSRSLTIYSFLHSVTCCYLNGLPIPSHSLPSRLSSPPLTVFITLDVYIRVHIPFP